MTLFDLLRVVLRRWPVVVVGALITCSFLYLIRQEQGVYWSRTTVVFLAPSSAIYPNSLATDSGALIVTAGVVEKRVTGPGKVTKYADPSVNLAGLGIRDGWSISLPDTGGQWAPNFTSRELNVEVVGPSPQEVRAKQSELVGRLRDALRQVQVEWKVAPVNYVTLTTPAEPPVVNYLVGRRPRAEVMTLLLGGVGTVTACVVVDDLLRRRRKRREESSADVRSRDVEHVST